MTQLLLTSTSEAIVQFTLNRPDKRNALSLPLLQELLKGFQNLPKTVRIVIIDGAGPSFCAGLDLQDAGDPAQVEAAGKLVGELFYTIATCPAVTIAAVQGSALAGGLGIIAACDIVIASSDALFSLPEIRRGLIPALVHTLLQGQISQRFLQELVLTGEPITAARAHAIGLINHVVTFETLSHAIENITQLILKSAPGAIGTYKKELQHPRIEARFKEAISLFQKVSKSSEAREGITAFLEKRPPAWMQNG